MTGAADHRHQFALVLHEFGGVARDHVRLALRDQRVVRVVTRVRLWWELRLHAALACALDHMLAIVDTCCVERRRDHRYQQPHRIKGLR